MPHTSINAWAALRADTHRQYGRSGPALVWRGLLFNRTFRLVATMRPCQAACAAGGLLRLCLPIMQVLHRIACQLAGGISPGRPSLAPVSP